MNKNNSARLKKISFPRGFLWGVSTSAYQIEGGVINDWSEWEKSAERMERLKAENKETQKYICGRACDSYNRWREDISLVEELNCNSYRLGLEWARIEPRKGEWADKEINRYREIFKELKKRNIKTVVTLWHWTNPLWVRDSGGWANKEIVNFFSQYTEKIAEELGDLVDYWITLNEPMVHVANGYVNGKFPPNRKKILQANQVFKNLVRAHKESYKILHRKNPRAQVSITKLTNDFEPARRLCFLDRIVAGIAHYFWNERLLRRLKNHLDFIGLDYYFHDRMVWYPPFKKNKNKEVTDMGWEIYPRGIYRVLKYLAEYQKPIIILENGLADSEDKHRRDFIKDHLFYVHKAISEGADVRGYFYWSLLDNFEWAEGWEPKFGLYKVDRETFERSPRPSAFFYSQVCRDNELKLN